MDVRGGWIGVQATIAFLPDLNPIEENFRETKNFMREIWNKHGDSIKYDFASFVEHCVSVVGERKENAQGYFRRAGISINELQGKVHWNEYITKSRNQYIGQGKLRSRTNRLATPSNTPCSIKKCASLSS